MARLLLPFQGTPNALVAVRHSVDAFSRGDARMIHLLNVQPSALVRAVENSLTNRLLERSPVPVEVIGGAPAGALERFGIPAGVGAGMAWLWVGGS